MKISRRELQNDFHFFFPLFDGVSFRQHCRARPTGRGLQNETGDCVRLHALQSCSGDLCNAEGYSSKQMNAETDPKLLDSRHNMAVT